MLDMIEKLYQRFGITKNTKISSLERLENKDYPIFSDLINFVSEYRKMITNKEQLKIVDRLEILLDRFKVGTDAMLFNGYNIVDEYSCGANLRPFPVDKYDENSVYCDNYYGRFFTGEFLNEMDMVYGGSLTDYEHGAEISLPKI